MTERISYSLESSPVFHKKKIFPRMIVEAMRAYASPNIHAYGLENIYDIESTAEQKQVKRIFMGNHPNDGDTTVVRKALAQNEHRELERKMLPIKGTQLEKRFATRYLSRAYDTILAWQPDEIPADQAQREKQQRMFLQTSRTAKEALNRNLHLLIYPQAKVVPDESSMQGYPGVARLLCILGDGILLMPFRISGTKDMFSLKPPYLKRSFPAVSFGQPIELDSLKAAFTQSDGTRDFEGMISNIMKTIAGLAFQTNKHELQLR